MDKLLKPLLKGKTQKNLLTLLFILFIVLILEYFSFDNGLVNNLFLKATIRSSTAFDIVKLKLKLRISFIFFDDM